MESIRDNQSQLRDRIGRAKALPRKEELMVYGVVYKMHEAAIEKKVYVPALSKAEAYDSATYDMIPYLEGCVPYSAWVEDVLYKNGNVRSFNTCEGLPY